MKKSKIHVLYLLLISLFITNCNKDTIDPIALFNYSLIGNYAPCKVEFDNLSRYAKSYKWDFGDSQTSIEENPTHIFMSGGSYNISLTVKNENGKKSTYSLILVIEDKPTNLKINEFYLEKFPLTNGSGISWDITSLADVYFKILDDQANSIFESGYYEDLDQNLLPVKYITGMPFTLSNLATQYAIILYDDDWPDLDEMIGGYYFLPENHYPIVGEPYPLKIEFGSISSDIQFYINIAWL